MDYSVDVSKPTFSNYEAIKIDHFKQGDFWNAMKRDQDNDDLFYYKASSVRVNMAARGPTTAIYGNVYIIEWDRPFFHAMHDIVGEFLLIREAIPDLKPIIIHNGEPRDPKEIFRSFWNPLVIKPNFIEDLLDIIGFNYDNFFFVNETDKLFIENLYTMSLYGEGLKSDLFNAIEACSDKQVFSKTNDASYPYRFAVSFAMRNFFAKFIPEVPMHRKIFVSVKHKRDMIEKANILYHFLDDNGVDWSMDWRTATNTEKVDGLDLSAFLPAQFNSGVKDANLRYISREYEEEVESFFRDQGFEIVTIDGTTLKEQMAMMAEAKIVAVWSGASQLQSLFVQNGSIFMYLAPRTSYGFPHEDILEVIKPDAKIFFDKRLKENHYKSFDSDTIIEAVKQVLKEA